jgi:ribosomal protein S18 acetylase RimI-like enzyme
MIRILKLKFFIYSKIFLRHVQVNNETAISFYKKFGFEIVEKKEQYYKRIEPSDAYVLKKSFDKKTTN